MALVFWLSGLVVSVAVSAVPAASAAPAPEPTACAEARALERSRRGSVEAARARARCKYALEFEVWMTELPPAGVVESHVGADPARRDATFQVLKDYVSAKVGWNLRTGTASAPPEAVARWREYRAAQTAGAPEGAAHATPLSEEAVKYYYDSEFRTRTIRELVSPSAVAAYEASPRHQRLIEVQQQARRERVKRVVARDKHLGVDRTIFGIELGEPLDLPRCPPLSGEQWIGGVLGRGKGGPQTCLGDPAIDIAARLLGRDVVAVRLADDECPEWLRAGGSCSVGFTVRRGIPLGASLVPGPASSFQTKVTQQLTKKYGRSPEKGEVTECVNKLTGKVTASANDLHWALSGLHVTYSPLASDCERGRIVVELESLRRSRSEADAAREEAEPRM